MGSHKYKAVSLFSGAGGMDIGVLQAGFEVLACIEHDPNACETLRHNIEKEGRRTQVLEGDVRDVDPAALMRSMRLKEGRLDLLFGGPPCQTFSQIGKQQGLEDERGLLLFQMVRFARVFKPRAVLIENVKGLLSAQGAGGVRGEVLQHLVQELEELGYSVKWQVLTAADYGVAQLRHRVFVVAMSEPDGFVFPEPTHAPNGSLTCAPYFTVGEALSGLSTPPRKSGSIPEDSHVDVTPEGDQSRINGVPEGWPLAKCAHLPVEQRKRLTAKDTTKFLRTHRERPSNTLRCGEVFYHHTENRYLTPREYMRLHGYPDDYELRGPVRGRTGVVKVLDQHRLVANSVPPPVARVVAESIRGALKCQKSTKPMVTQ